MNHARHTVDHTIEKLITAEIMRLEREEALERNQALQLEATRGSHDRLRRAGLQRPARRAPAS